MIKLFSVKEKQKQDAVAAAAGKPKQSAGELRVQKGGFAFCGGEGEGGGRRRENSFRKRLTSAARARDKAASRSSPRRTARALAA